MGVESRLSVRAAFRGASRTSSPEDLALLRARIALLGKVGVPIAVAFNVVGIALDLVVTERTLPEALVAADNLSHLLVTALLGLLWVLPSRLPRLAVVWLDLAFLPLVDGLFLWQAALITTTPPVPLATMAIAFTALGRAIVVPSSPAWTFVVTTLGCLPTAVGSWFLLADAGELRLPQTAFALLWHAGTIALASVASSVIYGLRREVTRARKLGQYTLLRRIGSGGMGEVYLASHALLRRPTAVKLLARSKDPAGIERFEREVQLTSRLTHPNTISVYDYGRTPDGVFYYAMEYLDGWTLERLVKDDGPQPPARVARLLSALCDALAEAHGVGLIHRDVKPANVFLCERGGHADVVKVLDFGLVKDIGATDSGVTQVNTLTGTPLYMSPEAIQHPERVDARSDLYAVGCVAYALLTGKPPFVADNIVEICAAHLHTTPTPPSKKLGRALPAELEALVLGCLAKDPAERPKSAAELRDRLLALEHARAWTEADARQWWESRRSAPPSADAEGDDADLGAASTLGVDVADRAPDAAAPTPSLIRFVIGRGAAASRSR